MNGNSVYSNWVIRIIIINVVFFFLQAFTSPYLVQYSFSHGGEMVQSGAPIMTFYLGLTPALVLEKYFIWQFFTYMFLHGGFFHIFLNMYALLIFGIPIEQTWGSRKFLLYYLFTGTGAGITIFVINLAIGGSASFVPTIGASGAVFGLLLAFGILYPNAEILLFFFLPIKAKYLVVLYGGIELYSLVSTGGQGNISHVGHLGGLVFGLLFFFITRKRGIQFKTKIRQAKLVREISSKKSTAVHADDNISFLGALLEKVKQTGHESLSDDEMQRLKYIEIMKEDTDDLCVDEDFNPDDPFCKKCANVEACLIREIKKYL